jgi:hypothetical protein
VLLAVSACVFYWHGAFAEECKPLQRYGKIPFATSDDLRISLAATLGGKSTHLTLDTGAYWSSIRKDLVDELGLRTRTGSGLHLFDLAGEKMDRVAIVPDVKVGALGYGDAEFFVAGPPPAPIEEDAGLMGQNLLNKIDLEIDNANRTVSLFSQDHCDGDGVHWADEAVVLEFKQPDAGSLRGSRTTVDDGKSANKYDVPIVWAQFEGRNVAVLFDTGATNTSMDLDLARNIFGIDEKSPGVKEEGVAYVANGGTVKTYSYTFKKLAVAGVTFENVPVLLSQFDGDKDVLLGMHELRHLHLYIAYKEGRIYITAADTGNKAPAK